MWRQGAGGRGQGGQAPPSFHAVRAARRWIRFSATPSIWGRRVWTQPWMVLDCAVRSHMVQCARHLCPLAVDRQDPLLPSSLSLGIATPAPVMAVTECKSDSSSVRYGAPILQLRLFPSSATPKYNTASETGNVWRYHVLLTGNFPSTANTPATMMLASMHISRQISRPFVAMLTSCRLLDSVSACVPSV